MLPSSLHLPLTAAILSNVMVMAHRQHAAHQHGARFVPMASPSLPSFITAKPPLYQTKSGIDVDTVDPDPTGMLLSALLSSLFEPMAGPVTEIPQSLGSTIPAFPASESPGSPTITTPVPTSTETGSGRGNEGKGKGGIDVGKVWIITLGVGVGVLALAALGFWWVMWWRRERMRQVQQCLREGSAGRTLQRREDEGGDAMRLGRVLSEGKAW